MSTKIKKQQTEKVSDKNAANAAAAYAMCTRAIESRQAKMANELAAAKEKIESKHLSFINQETELQTEAAETLKTYADQERDNWEVKSIQLSGVTMGFRLGRLAVQLPKGVKADIMVQRLRDAGLKRYLRVVEELNKPAMLDEKKESALNQLAECGIGFGQSETFYIEVS